MFKCVKMVGVEGGGGENRAQICEKIAKFGVFTLFLDIDLGF